MTLARTGIALAAVLGLALSVTPAGAASGPPSGPPGNPFDSGPPDPNAPKPSPDPRDLRGYYFMHSVGILLPGIDKDHPPFNAAGLALFRKRIARRQAGDLTDDPQVSCRPMNAVRMFGSGFPQVQFIQTRNQLTILLMEDHIVRRIFLNAKHPAHLVPTASGHSVGRWQGDTLIVDTIGFKPGGWLDETGTPGDRNEHMIERIRKTDGGQSLEDQVTVEDPSLFTRPVTFKVIYTWKPDAVWDEIICEEGNRDAAGSQGQGGQQ